MLIQRADSDGSGTLPPPGFTTPIWGELVREWESIPPPVQSSVTLGPETLVIGQDDCETDDVLPEFEHAITGHEFGWDNESPQREIQVDRFKIDRRPVTNGEFLKFWTAGGVDTPVSWIKEDGEMKVNDASFVPAS